MSVTQAKVENLTTQNHLQAKISWIQVGDECKILLEFHREGKELGTTRMIDDDGKHLILINHV